MLEWLQGDLPKNSVLIFTVRGTVNERNRLVRAIESVGRYRSFAPVEAGTSVNRDPLYIKVSEKFSEFGKQIAPRAFLTTPYTHLAVICTLSLKPLTRLSILLGDKRQIDEQDIRNVVSQNTFDNIFDLTDAIGKRSTGQALKSLHNVLAKWSRTKFRLMRRLHATSDLRFKPKLIAEKRELRRRFVAECHFRIL